MKKFYKVFSWLIGAVLFLGFSYILGSESIVNAFETLPLHVLFLWLILTLMSRAISTEVFYQPVKRLKGKISRSEAFWLLWAKSFSNQVVPFSGVSMMLGFLKSRATLSWGKISSLAWPQFFLAMQAIGLIGSYCAAILLLDNESAPNSIFFILAIFLLLLIMPQIVYITFRNQAIKKAIRIKKLETVSLALEFLSSHKDMALYLFVGHLASILIRVARLLLIFFFLGGDAEFNFLLLVSIIGEVAVLLNLTPGGIGMREAAIAIAAQVYGIDLDIALKAALLDRVLILVTTFVFGAASFFFLLRKKTYN